MGDSCSSALVLLLLFQISMALAFPESCIFPTFSHNNKDALSWIEDRGQYQQFSSQNEATQIKWPKSGRIRPVLVTETISAPGNESDQFLNWLHKGGSHTRRFFYRKIRPKIKHERDSTATRYRLIAVAARDLEAHDILLEIPVNYWISDEILKDDPTSLRGSPWELRIATKILRERAKSVDSPWYPLITNLPTSLRLPLFFSEAELNNTEDDFVIREVHALRTFAERSFLVLHQQETAGASFSEFAWALGLVYAFSCRKENLIHRGKLDSQSVHLLVPFFGIPTDNSSIGASIELDPQKLRIVMGSRAMEGSPLHCSIEAGTSQYSFLFHGFVPATAYSHDGIELFESLESLLDWYFSTYEERRNFNKNLLMTRVEYAIETLDSYLNTNLHMALPSPLVRRNYFVGMDGYIDVHLVYALYYLFHFESLQQTQTSVHEVADMGLESVYKGLLLGNHTIVLSELVYICRTSHAMNNECRNILRHVFMALKKRLCSLMHTSSTESEEDEALLMASLWEGFSDESGSHLCDTCQWQTEELSLNDYLSIQLRMRRKEILRAALSALPLEHDIDDCTSVESKEDLHSLDLVHTEDNEEFLKWCRNQGAQISEKLAIGHFTGNSNLSNPVRGVRAVEDIKQGETLSILPLNISLFKKASSLLAGADSWHLAAVNLLYEKTLGAKSKWQDYIAILPKKIQTPMYLRPNELKEIQWWPVLREVIQVRRAIELSFSQLKERELKDADFEEYKWAAIMVHSRAFTLPVEDDDEYAPYVLMPFMDMINHHYEYQADWMSVPVSNGKLEIVAKKLINKGQEVFASFGPRSNDNLFLYYGFVLENNPFDTAEIFASFQDAVYWFADLWQLKCHVFRTLKETEECVLKDQEDKWVKAQRAMEDYSAGVTEQRAEWWTLVNMWADYGYEYMQFKPSPSIYMYGIVDPTLLVALEAVADTFILDITYFFGDGEGDGCDADNSRKCYVDEFFMCIQGIPWRSSKWALHSSFCSTFLARTISAIDQKFHADFMVKVSLSLRCLEVLNSMPTTLTEDRQLVEANDANVHIQLARRYRYMKKLFIKQFIDGISKSF